MAAAFAGAAAACLAEALDGLAGAVRASFRTRLMSSASCVHLGYLHANLVHSQLFDRAFGLDARKTAITTEP